MFGLKEALPQKPDAQEGDKDNLLIEEEELCIICMEKKIDTLIRPCNHMNLCHKCAGDLRSQSMVCPICKERMDSFVKLKFV